MTSLLPNESLITVLQFADYKTLVLTKLSTIRFLRLAIKYAAELAHRRSFQVRFYFSSITCEDIKGDSRQGVRYEPYNQASLRAACQEIDVVICTHAVVGLCFGNSALSVSDISAIFEAAPSLNHAEDLSFGPPSVGHFQALMSRLAETKTLVLWLDDDVIQRFDWTFLRRQSAHELRRIRVCVAPNLPSEGAKRSIERLIRVCATLPRLLDGDGMELDFTQSGFSGVFALCVIKLLENSSRALTFRMAVKEDGNGLILDECDYAVDLERYATETITRYLSKKSEIVVEDKGRTMVIRCSTGDPPKQSPNGPSHAI